MLSTLPCHLMSAALLALVVSACTSYGPGGVPVGSSVDAAIKDMGPPTGEYALPDGGRKLEFARGPFGKDTYMLSFDGQGKLVKKEQVMTEAHFALIEPGMDTKQVLFLLGHPAEYMGYGWHEKRVAWSYRYFNSFCLWFQIGVNQQGTVVDSAYGNDPICERRDLK